MAWKIKLVIVLVVICGYAQYLKSNTDRALQKVDQVRTIYVDAIQRADQIAQQ
ncbi:hypothetical protein IT414_03780 [bacterium]|nr:hypothetical protein [bacterium]